MALSSPRHHAVLLTDRRHLGREHLLALQNVLDYVIWWLNGLFSDFATIYNCARQMYRSSLIKWSLHFVAVPDFVLLFLVISSYSSSISHLHSRHLSLSHNLNLFWRYEHKRSYSMTSVQRILWVQYTIKMPCHVWTFSCATALQAIIREMYHKHFMKCSLKIFSNVVTFQLKATKKYLNRLRDSLQPNLIKYNQHKKYYNSGFLDTLL